MRQAKIIIKDEVNIKIEGLDLDIRRACFKKFEYEMPGARYLPSVRLGRWNGKISFFSLAGSSYVNLLEHIIPILQDYDYDIEVEDLRTYTTTFNFTTVTEKSYSHKVWPANHLHAGEPIELRDYQVEIINTFLANPQSLQEFAGKSGFDRKTIKEHHDYFSDIKNNIENALKIIASPNSSMEARMSAQRMVEHNQNEMRTLENSPLIGFKRRVDAILQDSDNAFKIKQFEELRDRSENGTFNASLIELRAYLLEIDEGIFGFVPDPDKE